MVEQQEHYPSKLSQGTQPFLNRAYRQKKRVLQGGFAELEGVLWTSLLFFILVSFITLLIRIEKDSQYQVKEFQIEWNKIEK